MDKPFYVSGFLYNLKTQQILLFQPLKDSIVSHWSMLGGESKKGEEAAITFQRIVKELLNLELKTKQIYPIYDYFHQSLEKTNYVFYAVVGKKLSLDSQRENTLSWVTFPETLKLLFTAQTKQDVIVGQRVINLKERQDQARKEELHPSELIIPV